MSNSAEDTSESVKWSLLDTLYEMRILFLSSAQLWQARKQGEQHWVPHMEHWGKIDSATAAGYSATNKMQQY